MAGLASIVRYYNCEYNLLKVLDRDNDYMSAQKSGDLKEARRCRVREADGAFRQWAGTIVHDAGVPLHRLVDMILDGYNDHDWGVSEVIELYNGGYDYILTVQFTGRHRPGLPQMPAAEVASRT